MVSADRSRVTLRLSVPYGTRWGQMVRVMGDGAALGNGQVDEAPELACRHVGDRLLWFGEVTVPRAPAYSYKYVVVGEGGNVEDEELSARELRLPAELAAGAVVDVHDEWQVCCCLTWETDPRLLQMSLRQLDSRSVCGSVQGHYRLQTPGFVPENPAFYCRPDA